MLLELSDTNKLRIYNAKDDFNKLINTLQSESLLFGKSDFYKGLKSVVQDLSLSISNLKEIIEDTIFFFEAKNDNEFANIFSKIADA